MTDTMRAVKIEGPKQLSAVDTAIPQPDGNKVIIKISKCGICGSDIHMWENGDRIGMIMGHELGGTVIDAGSREDLKVGDRVTAIPINPCGECIMCKSNHNHMCINGLKNGSPGVTSDGAYAQYFASRPDMVRKLPDTLSDNEAAMIEPVSVGLHAVNLANIKSGEKVLIIGGGIIGLVTAAWARIFGASYVAMTEANDLRGKKALALGDVHEVFDAKDQDVTAKLLQASKGGFDKALDCSAVPAGINTAIMALKPLGTLVFVGISYTPVPVNTLFTCLKELNFVGQIGYSPEEFDHALELMSRKVLETERFVDNTIGLDGVQEAFELLKSGTTADVKILIEP